MSHGRHPRAGLASAGLLRASLGAAPGGGADGGTGPGPGSMDGVAGGPGGAAEDDGYLTGQFLVAMPAMTDSRFEKSVIYVCAHSEEGAMGIVVNQQLNQVRFADLLEQLDIAALPSLRDRPVLFGGPVETGRGFVLHSLDVMTEETLAVEEAGSGEATIGLTGTLEMLRAVASGAGPDRAIFALGYAGWAPGQLDAEIQANGWLTAPADPAIVFDPDLEAKWARVMAMLGIDPALLSVEAGHA